MDKLALQDFHPPALFHHLRRRWIEPVGDRFQLTDSGRAAIGSLSQASKPGMRLNAVDWQRMKRLQALAPNTRRDSAWYFPEWYSEDPRRARRRKRIRTMLVSAGCLDLVEEMEASSDDQDDVYRQTSIPTPFGEAYVVLATRLLDANHDSFDFVVSCYGKIYIGYGSGDVAGEGYLYMAGMEARESQLLELVGGEYAASLERFLPWALGHLLSETPPDPMIGQSVDDDNCLSEAF